MSVLINGELALCKDSVRVPEKYIPLIKAALNEIRRELDRLYWNKYQKIMNSPFDNTGEKYANETFLVQAYNWNEDEDLPNFKYRGLSVYWYKHSNRGVEAYLWPEEFTVDFLADMIKDCFDAMKIDFGENDDQ